MSPAEALLDPAIKAAFDAQVAAAVAAALAAKNAERKNPTLNQIFDWYEANCRAREIPSLPRVLALSKRPREQFGDLTIDEFNEDVEDRMLNYAAWRRTHQVRRHGAWHPISDSTINREVRNIKAATNHAARKQRIDPSQNLWLPKPQSAPPRERVLSHEEGGELQRVMAAVDDARTPEHLQIFMPLSLMTGQRKGAVLALRREHIDLERRIIWFSKTQKRKTKKKRQDQPIHDALLPVVTRALAIMDRTGCDAVVQFRGKPVHDIRGAYQALLKRAGVAHATVHDLRRTTAQTVRDETDDLGRAAGLLGNTEAQCDSTYARPKVERNLKAMDVMAAKIGLQEAPYYNVVRDRDA